MEQLIANKLEAEFFAREDVMQISRELLGKYLMTEVNGIVTGGIITETEAYAGETDQASHAYGGRRTNRTEIMYGKPGMAYVYLCYGIHHLFNVVTNLEGTPHAVLIRAIKPDIGMETILNRRNMTGDSSKPITSGPGTLTEALGITTADNGIDLRGDRIWIENRDIAVDPKTIVAGPRVGVDYAGEDSKLPFRFRMSL